MWKTNDFAALALIYRGLQEKRRTGKLTAAEKRAVNEIESSDLFRHYQRMWRLSDEQQAAEQICKASLLRR